ncbi:unnamed protein product [Rhizopus stolonifer]
MKNKKGKKRATNNPEAENLLDADKKYAENLEKNMKSLRLSFASRFVDLVAPGKSMKEAGKVMDICEKLAEGKIIQLVQCDDGEESNDGEFDKDNEEKSSIPDRPLQFEEDITFYYLI